jgi:L-aspartate oxidase
MPQNSISPIKSDLILTREFPRYTIDFDLSQITQIQTDFLIIGGGAAGLRAAIETSNYGETLLVTKDKLGESSTMNAQGGIAVAINAGDQVRFHVEDTLNAGDGMCDEEAVKVMVQEGIDRVKELVSWGANFDKEDNELVFTMEAAHSMRRIIHARGDATGEETEDVLIRKASELNNIQFMDRKFVIDLLTIDDRCFGAILLDEENSTLFSIISKATILAAGGLGQLYRYTTNPEVSTGDGYAVAYRAGCEMTDMEFVQFHPTSLYVQGAPRFLISEAVRGEGAILINANDDRFMESYHEKAELAPRDVVSRAIIEETERTDTECVFLDLRHLDAKFIKERFPTISEKCSSYGIDISKDLIPVQASAHFMMGGVKTNIEAETNIKGLYACGEVACTKVHGANRLASNSLLETLVFSVRAASSAIHDIHDDLPESVFRIKGQSKDTTPSQIDIAEARRTIRELMWENVGIVRNAEILQDAICEVKQYKKFQPEDRDGFELYNMQNLASLIIEAAIIREESRGAHYRSDYPHQDDICWKRHIVFRRYEDK